MSYDTEMRREIDKLASKAQMESSGLSQEEYCRLHPEDPICRSYDEVYPKRQMYQPPQELDPEPRKPEPEPEPEPEPQPTYPPKPPPEEYEYPPKPPPYEQPPKPPPREEDEQPSWPPELPPPKPPVEEEDIPTILTTDYDIKTDEYRGAMGGLDMYTKTCPVCGASVPAGTNFCARCGYIIEVFPRGTGGRGGSKGQGT